MDQDTTREVVRKAGGVVALAGKLGITKSAVSQWERVPAEHVIAVEAASGVSRHDLRPDVFGPAPDPKPRRRSTDVSATDADETRAA